jgi:hypothetical protein
MIINREWAMPNSNTFSIKPIGELIKRHIFGHSVDPFAKGARIATVTNDIDPQHGCDFNMDAIDFLKSIPDASVDTVLYDPPYTVRQVAECYKGVGKKVNMETTQSSFWSNLKDEIVRITKPGSKVISFGYNSNGIGKTRGFELMEILLVPHGGPHFDTICTVEVKNP